MAKIFISYSRADKQFVERFVPLIRRVYGNDSLWYDYDIHGGSDWWQMILDEIGKCQLFIYLVSNESLESSYCQAELHEALRLNKQILPVIVRRLSSSYPANIADDIAQVLSPIQYVDMAGGFRDADTIASLYASINGLLDLSQQERPAFTNAQPTPEPTVADKKPKNNILPIVYSVVIVLAIIFISIIVSSLWQNTAQQTDDPTEIAQVTDSNEVLTITPPASTIIPTEYSEEVSNLGNTTIIAEFTDSRIYFYIEGGVENFTSSFEMCAGENERENERCFDVLETVRISELGINDCILYEYSDATDESSSENQSDNIPSACTEIYYRGLNLPDSHWINSDFFRIIVFDRVTTCPNQGEYRCIVEITNN